MGKNKIQDVRYRSGTKITVKEAEEFDSKVRAERKKRDKQRKSERV